MFRARAPGHKVIMSELSYNTTTGSESNSDTESSDGGGNGNGDQGAKPMVGGREGFAKITFPGKRTLPLTGKRPPLLRRMTFGGLRSDKAGEVCSYTQC